MKKSYQIGVIWSHFYKWIGNRSFQLSAVMTAREELLLASQVRGSGLIIRRSVTSRFDSVLPLLKIHKISCPLHTSILANKNDYVLMQKLKPACTRYSATLPSGLRAFLEIFIIFYSIEIQYRSLRDWPIRRSLPTQNEFLSRVEL